MKHAKKIIALMLCAFWMLTSCKANTPQGEDSLPESSLNLLESLSSEASSGELSSGDPLSSEEDSEEESEQSSGGQSEDQSLSSNGGEGQSASSRGAGASSGSQGASSSSKASGGAGKGEGTPNNNPAPGDDKGAWDKGGDYTGSIHVNMPTASGTVTLSGDKGAVVDISNTSAGYIMIKVTGASNRVKALVTGPGGKQYQYPIGLNGAYEAIPLQMGTGAYTVVVAENTTGTKYSVLLNESFHSAGSTNYLMPNQKINYSSNSAAVRKGYGLCINAKNDLDKVKSVYNWIVSNISYDYGKASSVSDGYIPNVDSTYSSRSGICYDYAALMAAMLRTQGIPTKLVAGNAGGVYHAWNQVYIKNIGWITVRFQVTAAGWKLMDPTFASNGREDFTLNAGNYTATLYY